MLSERGRSEQKEEVLAFLADQLLPAAGAASPRRAPTLEQAWAFAQQAGLAEPLRVALARRVLAARPGPWNTAVPESFVDAVAAVVIDESRETPALARPALDRLWVRDLVARDRPDELWTFLAARWDALAAEVRGPAPVDPNARYTDWRSWLDPETLALWVEGAKRDPGRLASVGALLTERRQWDRLWALGAKQWDVAPVIAALPDDARARWFRMWLVPSPGDPDPAVRARGEQLERATLAVGRLVAGVDGAARDPVIEALRGARTVGAALDERARPSRDLWGERPGPGWLVLEALARVRAADASSALVPLEVGDRSGETARARLAAQLAEAAGDTGLALEMTQQLPSSDPADVARRVRLLQKAGRGEEGTAAFREEARKLQPRLTEAVFRRLARAADDLALPDPLSLLDPSVPVPGAFAAFVCDVRGLEACRALQPVSRGDFRSSLSARWQQRPRTLTAAETRYALVELWANEAGPLPRASLGRLGPVWARAAGWLESVRPGERSEAIAAIEALPDDSRLRALLGRETAPSAESWLLRLRVHLLRGEDAKARDMLLARIAEADGAALSFSPVQPAAGGELADDDADADRTEDSGAQAYEQADPLLALLRAALAPFREAGKLPLVEDAAGDALLRRALARPQDVALWALALDLARTPEARAQVLPALERAWRMGDLEATALAPVVEAAGRVSPADAERWLARLATSPGIAGATTRARLLARLGRKPDGARFLAETRARGAWTAADEVRAFDLWRSLAPAATANAARAKAPASATVATPTAWDAARPFWTRPAVEAATGLAAHLRAHPLDLRAARAALRSAGALDPDTAALAARPLQQPSAEGDSGSDLQLLRLREARSWLGVSPAAARRVLGGAEPGLARELERRRLSAAEVRSALADVARILASASPRVPAVAVRGAGELEAALAPLEDRDPAAARTLRAELRQRAPAPRPLPYRLANGRPEPWRPMDLDWPAVQTVADAEDAR